MHKMKDPILAASELYSYSTPTAVSTMLYVEGSWKSYDSHALSEAIADYNLYSQGSFTLDGISYEGQSEFDPIRWQVIDHLNTYDWKFFADIHQIPKINEDNIQTQIFTEYTDSVFDPSAFSETVTDSLGRIEKITYFSDFDHNYPRYAIDFTYDGNSMDLTETFTRHYDISGTATHTVEETYIQDINGDTIADTYVITELVPPPIAPPYEGNDPPGTGDNILLPGQLRIWTDALGVANDGLGEPGTVYHLTNIGGVYHAVEMSQL